MSRALFGGALEITLLCPEEFVDASALRQVPDNQECFVSQADANRSIIIELLESVDGATDAVLFHWNELVEANDATHHSILKKYPMTPLPGIERTALYGSQVIPKFGKAHDLHRVPVWLALLRVPRVHADILISYYGGDGNEQVFLEMCDSVKIKDWSLFK